AYSESAFKAFMSDLPSEASSCCMVELAAKSKKGIETRSLDTLTPRYELAPIRGNYELSSIPFPPPLRDEIYIKKQTTPSSRSLKRVLLGLTSFPPPLANDGLVTRTCDAQSGWKDSPFRNAGRSTNREAEPRAQ